MGELLQELQQGSVWWSVIITIINIIHVIIIFTFITVITVIIIINIVATVTIFSIFPISMNWPKYLPSYHSRLNQGSVGLGALLPECFHCRFFCLCARVCFSIINIMCAFVFLGIHKKHSQSKFQKRVNIKHGHSIYWNSFQS